MSNYDNEREIWDAIAGQDREPTVTTYDTPNGLAVRVDYGDNDNDTRRGNYRQRRRPSNRPARWMDLKYAGRCHVCADPLPAGSRGFYDPATRQVTCLDMGCCEADGLTRQEWNGSPVSGSWITVRAETRLGGQR